MKIHHILLIILLSLIVTVVTLRVASERSAPTESSKDTVFEQIKRTNTLRCGYQYWDSAVMRDEKTGQLYGAFVDIMKAIGEATGLKIEWTEQVGWDDVGAALKSRKIDVMCAGMWTSAAKAKEIAFTTPLAYQAIEAFVRTDDHRFDGNFDTLNSPDIRIAVIDNDNSDFIAQQDYPKAQKIGLGQMNGTDSDLMMYVMSNKGDVTFSVTGLWRQFDKANPGALRRLAPDQKLRVFGLALAVDNEELLLLQTLNAGIQEIQNSGRLDKILDKANAAWPDMYIKPLKPFP